MSDLDARVAEVVGLNVELRSLGGTGVMQLCEIRDKGKPGSPVLVPYAFHPSRDLNAAFSAAEKVGLFKRYCYCEASGQHVISETAPVASWSDTLAHAPTAAEAICQAILKLRGEKDDRLPPS